MLTFYFTDHRAPRWVPRGTNPDDNIRGIATLCALVATVFTVGTLMFSGGDPSPIPVTIAAVGWLAVAYWLTGIRRWLIRAGVEPANLDEHGSATAAVLFTYIGQMQAAWRAYPSLRTAIEPSLIASYDLARAHDLAALKVRADAVLALVAELKALRAAAPDNSDLLAVEEITRRIAAFKQQTTPREN